ncbi:MAG TPA: hypothetical protein ENK57_25880, partial [Polyangiaceae bacterium]|nr:hypothetical protein [Polyangiaceae bacterium]
FDFLHGDDMCGERFAELFEGPARQPESRITKREMDVARSIQEVTERIVLQMARHAHAVTGAENLCMAGGVALNCVANGRLLREGPFSNIWIQPAAGDAGGALGAALDAHHRYFERPRVRRGDGRPAQRGSCFGPSFGDEEIEAFLDTQGVPFRRLSSEERAPTVAGLLAEGTIVGHFAGRTEFGPRALGARSILGDARNPDMQVKLNLKIKYRESFRPFAPAVLWNRAPEYFELEGESPYMLLVAPVHPDRRLPYERGDGEDMLEIVQRPRSDVPAVTHVDYSARVQTVHPCDNPRFHELLAAFEEQTGCPLLVNTSFNVRGEPIVNTPYDAYRCFMRTDMDALVLEDFLLLKEEQPPWPEEGRAMDEWAVENPRADPELVAELEAIFDETVEPKLRSNGSSSFGAPGWHPVNDSAYPRAIPEGTNDPVMAIVRLTHSWTSLELTEAMSEGLRRAFTLVDRRLRTHAVGTVSDRAYVMF